MPELRDISNAAYHALGVCGPDGAFPIISKTMLAKFAQAPRMFEWHYLLRNPTPEPTENMILGTAAHMMALEPQFFDRSYAILPETNREGKKFIRDRRTAEYREFLAAAGDKQVFREQDLVKVRGIAKALREHPIAGVLLENRPGATGYSLHDIERSLFWTDEETGLECRCRPDDSRIDDDVIIDVKVSASADPEDFAKTAWNLHYDVSVAHTCAGYEACYGRPVSEYLLLVVEPVAPFLISCFTTMEGGANSIAAVGRHRWRNLLRRVAACKKDDVWPGYRSKIEPLRFPPWAMRSVENNLEGE